MDIEIGVPYEFTLQSGVKKVIIVRGSKAIANGQTVILVNVDGIEREYPSLQDAIGEPYVTVGKA